jgi:NAD(P)-dependent dehydrogenase (short-subunit alcohol dehydrogenase family)
MSTETAGGSAAREPVLPGQTVVVIGGSAGIGLETARLPARRVPRRSSRAATPSDVAALAAHLMSNTALTGATYDVDGGQQLVA